MFYLESSLCEYFCGGLYKSEMYTHFIIFIIDIYLFWGEWLDGHFYKYLR